MSIQWHQNIPVAVFLVHAEPDGNRAFKQSFGLIPLAFILSALPQHGIELKEPLLWVSAVPIFFDSTQPKFPCARLVTFLRLLPQDAGRGSQRPQVQNREPKTTSKRFASFKVLRDIN